MLYQCSQSSNNYEPVTIFLSKMGPSAIDIAFSSLCHGMHDLDEGLPLLHLASQWLLDECQSQNNFEVINAYLHRFLHLHASTIVGIDSSWQNGKNASELINDNEVTKNTRVQLLELIKNLKAAHRKATEGMKNKLQESLCLLKHFSRII